MTGLLGTGKAGIVEKVITPINLVDYVIGWRSFQYAAMCRLLSPLSVHERLLRHQPTPNFSILNLVGNNNAYGNGFVS